MTAKTITLTGAETRAVYSGGSNAWLRNDGADVIYAAAVPGITAGSDGVVSIPAGQSAPVYGAYGTVYLLGTGSVQLIGSDYSTNPFKTSAQSGGSGADSVARAAITAHAGNTEIHVTAAEKSVWDGLSNPNLLDNPDYAINQNGETDYISTGAVKFAVDRWRIQNTMSLAVGDGVTVKPTAELSSPAAGVLQNIPWNLTGDDIAVTLSANGSTNAGAYFRIVAANDSYTTLKQSGALVVGSGGSVTLEGIPAGITMLRAILNFPAGSNAESECALKWVKLEIGKNATPFCPPNPAVELLRCQRYFTIYKHQNATSSTDKCTIGVGYALTSSIVYAVLPIAAMRSGVTATISHSGLSLISGADTVVDYTSVTALEQTDSTVQVAFTVSGQTPGSVYRLRLMNSDAYLAVSKEL
jgi:hypothetical protein